MGDGEFTTATLIHQVPPDDPLIGHAVEIVLDTAIFPGPFIQTLYDHVRLDHVEVLATPLVHLDFEDGPDSAVATDATGNGFDGTLTSMDPATDWVTGVAGMALDFDGVDDNVSLADDPALDFGTGDFSVSQWVYKRATSAPPNDFDNLYGANKWSTGASPGTNEWALNVGSGSNVLKSDQPIFVIEVGATSYGARSPNDISLSEWHHVVGIRRGQSVRLYVDGVLEAENTSQPPGQAVNDVGRFVRIARNQATGFLPATDALFDEIRIYDVALDDGNAVVGETAGGEVAALFVVPEGLVPPTTTSTTTSSTTTTSTTTLPTPTTTSTTLPLDDQRLSGTKLLLKDKAGKPQKRKIVLLAKDQSATLGDGGAADDPTMAGGAVVVTSNGVTARYELPATGWKPFKKKDPTKGWKFGKGDPIKKVLFKTGKLVKIIGKGSGLMHGLDTHPAPVSVVLEIGAQRYCMEFVGGGAFKAGVKYLEKAAPAPGSCPAPSSPSGAFVD